MMCFYLVLTLDFIFFTFVLCVFVRLLCCFRERRKENDKVMFPLPLCTPFHPEAIYFSLSHTQTQKARRSRLKLSVISQFSWKKFNWKTQRDFYSKTCLKTCVSIMKSSG